MDSATLIDNLASALRIQSIVEIILGSGFLLIAIVFAVVANNSFRASYEAVSDSSDPSRQAVSMRRLFRAYFLSAIVLVTLVVAGIRLGSPASWLGVIDPRAAVILEQSRK